MALGPGALRCLLIAVLMCLGSTLSGAQAPPRTDSARRAFEVRIDGAAPGVSGRMLKRALAGAHSTWRARPLERTLVPRDTSFPHPLVVAGGTARIQARVAGDVIVVGGDLELGPGANIQGRAIAIGGVVRLSPWALVRDSTFSYPQHTYRLVEQGGESLLHYDRRPTLTPQPWFEWPGLYGLTALSYDRVQSVGLETGPEWVIHGPDILIQTSVGWHALLGGVDPAVHVRAPVGATWSVDLDARRDTRTNEEWIANTTNNSISAFLYGEDTRNYYRAWRAEGFLSRPIEFLHGGMTVHVGSVFERAHSLQPAVPPLYSVIGQTLLFSNRRSNPAIQDGDIASGVVELRYDHPDERAPWGLGVRTEVPFQTVGAARWVQNIVEGSVVVPTVGSQYWLANVHGVVTVNGPAPGQRLHGLGGPTSMSTRDILDRRGDQLLFVEQLYTFPIERWEDPLWGIPRFSIRHVIGSAGIGQLGTLNNEFGVRFRISILRTDIMYDPVSRRSMITFATAIGL